MLEEKVERGRQAARILNDPLVREAFDTVGQTLHELWAECPVRDREGQHELKLMLKLLSDLKGFFDLAISDGSTAAEEIKAREQAKRAYSPAQWKREYYGY